MRETYYVGYDPKRNVWAASPITHDFSEESWVFRVNARTTSDAIDMAKAKLKSLVADPSPDELAVFKHIRSQVDRLSRTFHELMIIDVPNRMVNHARKLSESGYFGIANTDEILLDTSSAGWKAIQKHMGLNKTREFMPRRIHDESLGMSL